MKLCALRNGTNWPSFVLVPWMVLFAWLAILVLHIAQVPELIAIGGLAISGGVGGACRAVKPSTQVVPWPGQALVGRLSGIRFLLGDD